MVKIVTDGAIMCCTLGTWQAKLMVLSQSFRSISGALVATEEDKIGLNNIPSFGVCKCSSPNPPCIDAFFRYEIAFGKSRSVFPFGDRYLSCTFAFIP